MSNYFGDSVGIEVRMGPFHSHLPLPSSPFISAEIVSDRAEQKKTTTANDNSLSIFAHVKIVGANF